MIAASTHTTKDQESLERLDSARGSWREGNYENALLLTRTIIAGRMSADVAVRAYSLEASCLADLGDFEGSLVALGNMALYLHAADTRLEAAFYNNRGRAHKNLGNIDAALMDYAGAVALWQACGDREYEGAVSINLAELYLEVSDLDQADLYVERALNVLPQGSVYLCNAHDTKAKVLLAKGMPACALPCIDKALELFAGDNAARRIRFFRTKIRIRRELIRALVSSGRMKDVEKLKVGLIRRALKQSEGSITAAAKMLGTSRQAITYVADHNGIGRSKRKKSIIKALR